MTTCHRTHTSHHALTRRQSLLCLLLLPGAGHMASAQSAPFDHGHAEWTALLKKHVVVQGGGRASQLRYAGMAGDRAALKAYTDTLSAVTNAQFDSFSKPQQMAFLVNAYNAFTVALILTRYPDLVSIKDLGGFLQSPWKPRWVPLLGDKVSLDDIEHQMLRKRGRFDDPRVHFAVNCASVGCPALREEAFVADRLDSQLDEQAQRFLSDRTRNRFNTGSGALEVSKIFDWFGEDFRLGHRGVTSLETFLGRHAQVLADSPAHRDRVRAGQAPIRYLDYDWRLNDAGR
jgi:hypothetical protein